MCTLLTQTFCLMWHIQELRLYHNNIGDAGLTALAKAVESGALTKLTTLYLMNNKITDDGFATLMPLLKKDGKLSGLTEFGIGSGITDKGMKEFADILSMGALDKLRVSWCPTALSPCLETWCVHSPDSEHLFDVSYAETLPWQQQDF